MEIKNVNNELRDFYGTEQWYRHPATKLLYTDGVQYLAEKYECYWLIDSILSYNIGPNAISLTEDFQKWELTRIIDNEQKTNRFCLTCDDGRGNILVTQAIPLSDFEGDKVTLYFSNDTLLLPSEN